MAYNVKNWNNIENYLFETYGIESAYDDKLHDLMSKHDEQIYNEALRTKNNPVKENREPIENSLPVIQYNDVKATLLSLSEYNQYKDIIPRMHAYTDCHVWWLRPSVGDSLDSDSTNSVYACPREEDYLIKTGIKTENYIRPLFCISTPDASLYEAGDKVYIAGLKYDCTVLKSDKHDTVYALYDASIGCRCFDQESNDWERSEIKVYLDNFLEKLMRVPLLSKDAHITDATLLSIEEFKRYSPTILDMPAIPAVWWLRSPGNNFYSAMGAYVFGSAVEDGLYVNFTELPIRPAFYVAVSDPSAYRTGDKLELSGLACTVLDITGDQLYVLSDNCVARQAFDKDKENNDWETSSLKVWLEAYKDQLLSIEQTEELDDECTFDY